MSRDNPELLRAVDFILKRARSEEINMLYAALEARKSQGPKSIEDLNFKQMAKDMSEEVTRRFGLGQSEGHVRDMAKRMVTDLIREKVPDISERDLNILVDQWTSGGGGGGQGHAGKEELLPPDAVESMIDQFVRYSLRKMPQQEINELQQSLPDWIERYWEIFSVETKKMIKDLLEAKIDTKEFWAHVHNKLANRQQGQQGQR